MKILVNCEAKVKRSIEFEFNKMETNQRNKSDLIQHFVKNERKRE